MLGAFVILRLSVVIFPERCFLCCWVVVEAAVPFNEERGHPGAAPSPGRFHPPSSLLCCLWWGAHASGVCALWLAGSAPAAPSTHTQGVPVLRMCCLGTAEPWV